MIIYEIIDVDANGDRGYGRYSTKKQFLAARTKLADDDFIRYYNWTITDTGLQSVIEKGFKKK